MKQLLVLFLMLLLVLFFVYTVYHDIELHDLLVFIHSKNINEKAFLLLVLLVLCRFALSVHLPLHYARYTFSIAKLSTANVMKLNKYTNIFSFFLAKLHTVEKKTMKVFLSLACLFLRGLILCVFHSTKKWIQKYTLNTHSKSKMN